MNIASLTIRKRSKKRVLDVPSRRLNAIESEQANALLTRVREQLAELSGGDEQLLLHSEEGVMSAFPTMSVARLHNAPNSKIRNGRNSAGDVPSAIKTCLNPRAN
jgi:hypothetical protein